MPDGPTPKAPDDDDGFDARTRYQGVVPRETPASDYLFDREQVAAGDRGLGQEQARCDAQPSASHHRARGLGGRPR